MAFIRIFSSINNFLFIVLAALTFSLFTHAQAQPAGAQGDDFIYRVRPNDTLIELSTRFTGTPNNWQTLQTINSISDTLALPIGKELRIPFSLIPQVPAQAQVVHAQGSAQRNGIAVTPQTTVHEGDILETGVNSFLTFKLPDDSITSIPPNSSIDVVRLRTFMGTGLVDAIFSLHNGEIDSTVAPDGQGTGRYEIRTPVSITGVRGTRLRVRADQHGSHTEVLTGMAQLGSLHANGPRLRQNQGTVVTTDGHISPVRTLLPAPVLHLNTDQQPSNTVAFDPVPGAVAYLVRISADEMGTSPVFMKTVTTSPVHYSSPGAGAWYISVRAIDDLGLMGNDSVLPFDGHAVLTTRYGLTVNTNYGDAVLLTDY